MSYQVKWIQLTFNCITMPDIIHMSKKELLSYEIIQQLVQRKINGTEAANLLGITTRHVRRLKQRVRVGGASALAHALRGKRGNRRLPQAQRERIQKLVSERYSDFSPTFAAEKLSEQHRIDHDPKTIQAIMAEAGLWKLKKDKQNIHRAWRERRAHYGELIQFDGSYHHWLEDRGGTGELCLLAAIDDATSAVTDAQFADHEGVFPVFGFWKRYVATIGKPLAIYLDKFSTYHMNHPLARENPDTLTQFQRAMEQLRVEVIPANSPQAKGRVERLFGTLQDRLVKELRLQNISTKERANEFLQKIFIPKFNAQFAVTANAPGNVHRPLSTLETRHLPSIFSKHTERTVQNDFTISFNNQWYQLTASQPATVCKQDTVIVEEYSDGATKIQLRGKYLNYRSITKNQPRPKQIPWVLAATAAKPDISKSL